MIRKSNSKSFSCKSLFKNRHFHCHLLLPDWYVESGSVAVNEYSGNSYMKTGK